MTQSEFWRVNPRVIRALDDQRERWVEREWDMRFGTVTAAIINSQGGRPGPEKDAEGEPIMVAAQPHEFFPRLAPEPPSGAAGPHPAPVVADQASRDEQVSAGLNQWLAMTRRAAEAQT